MWNCTLANLSETHAKQCNFSFSTSATMDTKTIGQNIAARYSSAWTSDVMKNETFIKQQINKLVQLWAVDAAYLDSNQQCLLPNATNKYVGDYLQV